MPGWTRGVRHLDLTQGSGSVRESKRTNYEEECIILHSQVCNKGSSIPCGGNGTPLTPDCHRSYCRLQVCYRRYSSRRQGRRCRIRDHWRIIRVKNGLDVRRVRPNMCDSTGAAERNASVSRSDTHLGSQGLKIEQPGSLHAKFDDGVPSVQDQPDTEPALDGRLAARYERMSEGGMGDGSGITIRQAVESRSEPLSGTMSVVCRTRNSQHKKHDTHIIGRGSALRTDTT